MSTVGLDGDVYLTAAAHSDMGRTRDNNEDSFLIADLDDPDRPVGNAEAPIDVTGRRILFALSDGMGGHQAGEVASALVVATLLEELRPRSDADPARLLERAITTANARVHDEAKRQGKDGMGATLTAVLVQGSEAWIAEVGDSRAYLLRAGRLRQLTRDQSLVQMLVDAGALTTASARTAPQKNIILQAIGLAPTIKVAICRLSLRRADRFLLCCDGLSNELDDSELAAVITESAPAVACQRAVMLANERGGRDNLTALIGVIDGRALASPTENERISETFQVLQEYGSPPVPRAPIVAVASAPAAALHPSKASTAISARAYVWLAVLVAMAVALGVTGMLLR